MSPIVNWTGNYEFASIPGDLNEALEREPYYTQSIEEIMTRFHGMTKFTDCGLQQRILDGGARSRISQIHYDGIRHW